MVLLLPNTEMNKDEIRENTAHFLLKSRTYMKWMSYLIGQLDSSIPSSRIKHLL